MLLPPLTRTELVPDSTVDDSVTVDDNIKPAATPRDLIQFDEDYMSPPLRREDLVDDTTLLEPHDDIPAFAVPEDLGALATQVDDLQITTDITAHEQDQDFIPVESSQEKKMTSPTSSQVTDVRHRNKLESVPSFRPLPTARRVLPHHLPHPHCLPVHLVTVGRHSRIRRKTIPRKNRILRRPDQAKPA